MQSTTPAALWRTSLVPFVTRRAAPAAASRPFSSSPSAFSHVGSLPLPIPASVTVSLPAALSLPPSTLPSSSAAQRAIQITGPLGSTSLSVPASIILNPSAAEGGSTILALSVHDQSVKEQRALWGLTRALLSNAVTGVSEGYRVVIRLVGVGYRAAVEPIPASLRAIRVSRPSSPSSSAAPVDAAPTDRLNLKLGYAHPIYVDIPAGITVTTPQPTRIVLAGTDKQKLGLFAAKIRRWRKPEPYRGKGIFVGDETIKLKEIKKK